jgi:hypothetical protein
MGKPAQLSIYDLCVQITGSFEGKGYGTVANNFDGQGISAGYLSFNLGQGTLQSYILNHVNLLSYDYFPIPLTHIHQLSNKGAVNWAKDNFYDIYGNFKPEWRDAWIRFMTEPVVINLQKQAIDKYFHQAKRICGRLGFSHDNRRAMAWSFDIAVQNWSLDIDLPNDHPDQAYNIITSYDQENTIVWIGERLDPIQRQLIILSHLRAMKSKPEWRKNVFTRKATIAIGCGWVNKTFYQLNKLF